MMKRNPYDGRTLPGLNTSGVIYGAPQVCGAIRLVPLLCNPPDVSGELRFALRRYHETATLVSVSERLGYCAYVPHGLVLRFTADGEPVAAWGGQLAAGHNDGVSRDYGFASVRVMERMAKREGPNQVRLLPLHLAMEGFLSLYFGGPDIAWEVYSRQVYRTGFSPRSEPVTRGVNMEGLSEAVRVFEIAEDQCGVLLFVADALASVFLLPHPDDYRALHETLLRDFYGDLMARYALLYGDTAAAMAEPDLASVHSPTDLYGVADKLRRDWGDYAQTLAGGLGKTRPLQTQTVREMGPFRLERFMTDLDLSGENHIGESVVRKNTGETLYAKSFRLSASQTKRAFFLGQLAASEWDVDVAASRLNVARHDLMLRIERAGFDYLFTLEVRAAARKAHGMRGDAVLK